MLDAEREIVALAAQIEIAVTPGVELGGAAQRLPAAGLSGTFFGVVDDDNGKRITALQRSEVGEQRGHLAAGILIDAVQPHEGIEDEEPRPEVGNGLRQAAP